MTTRRPGAVREAWRLLAESKRVANEPAVKAAFKPFGLEANRRNIDVLIEYMYRTAMIPKRFTVDELFNDVTATLA